MATAIEHAQEFARLLRTRDETKCIKYIDEYNDFYDIAVNKDRNSLYTPLTFACFYGLKQVALKLIHAGANVNLVSKIYTPLYCACGYYGDNNIVTELIRQGVDINYKYKKCSPLLLALTFEKLDIIITLIKAGANFLDIIDKHDHLTQKIMLCIRDAYRLRIKSVIDDNTNDNAMAISFKTIYVSGIIDIISKFII
ncbi:MAG: hypothetical protein Faunusvirus2_65 [Faunusvirus sp.]|jgi:ankyrin repeat protein|uniref:Uncharacterized protein n=1 Tax=Faunusvirus sp. TaxID=2487766 RepID=A0A3G4ZW37_9VIRU|nr:MAG: hypothetical protein Faunusvirus2_65 [Faunusvirus sp.]